MLGKVDPANVLSGAFGKEVPSQNRFTHTSQSLRMMYGCMLRLRDANPTGLPVGAVSISDSEGIIETAKTMPPCNLSIPVDVFWFDAKEKTFPQKDIFKLIAELS